MGSVGAPVVRRIIEVATGPERTEDLLAEFGFVPGAPIDPTAHPIGEDAYYDLLERLAAHGDDALPFRYARAIVPEDLGALGLAMKTAPTAAAALGRLIRYILVLSDTLDYELRHHERGAEFVLLGRPPVRRGAALANECALAAVVSMVRRTLGVEVAPRSVGFTHDAPREVAAHRSFFGCPVEFGCENDALQFDAHLLARPALLADEGLSSYFLAELDLLRARTAERSLVDSVRGAVADALADGPPSKHQIARRLGMSERTLHRRLADEGQSFQSLATGVRRELAERLLSSDRHSLAEVAFLTGFSEQSAFSRAFKRWTGSTPAAFRAGGG